MDIKKLVSSIKAEKPNVKSVYFVGCGASQADLYPAKYFLEGNAKELRVSIHTANEFVYATPAGCNKNAIVITCSLGGTTPETVAASKLAMDKGATVIALTHSGTSALAKTCHHLVVFGWEPNYSDKFDKMNKALIIAVEILNQYEGYADYEEMISGTTAIYGIIDEAVKSVVPQAQKFAKSYKDDEVIYLMSSGATLDVAYSFSICLLMEMQWKNSGSFNDGEFFHGPFEITDKNVPFILLMNEGRTRPMDSRALDFLNRFDAKVTVVDAKDYGLSSLVSSKVVEYLSPMVIGAVLRVYAEQLAIARNHPLTKRRYMWKLEY